MEECWLRTMSLDTSGSSANDDSPRNESGSMDPVRRITSSSGRAFMEYPNRRAAAISSPRRQAVIRRALERVGCNRVDQLVRPNTTRTCTERALERSPSTRLWPNESGASS